MEQPSNYLDAMRANAPLVQNITNYVAMNIMANVMLAAGASPAMVHAKSETPEFIQIASALSINIGTLDEDWIDRMILAAEAAKACNKPWVLDPVAVGATSLRRDVGRRLIKLSPNVIRGNASEILALSGTLAQGKGVDSADPVEAAEDAARALAGETRAVVAVTGATDFVTDGTRAARVPNGVPIMPSVTALGCALTGLVAAFIAQQEDSFESTIAALAYYGVAGEIAAAKAQGPGSFQVAFLDSLHGLSGSELDTMARIEML